VGNERVSIAPGEAGNRDEVEGVVANKLDLFLMGPACSRILRQWTRCLRGVFDASVFPEWSYRSNENKMSDGGRQRASVGVEA
jgi:hypothetical protein